MLHPLRLGSRLSAQPMKGKTSLQEQRPLRVKNCTNKTAQLKEKKGFPTIYIIMPSGHTVTLRGTKIPPPSLLPNGAVSSPPLSFYRRRSRRGNHGKTAEFAPPPCNSFIFSDFLRICRNIQISGVSQTGQLLPQCGENLNHCSSQQLSIWNLQLLLSRPTKRSAEFFAGTKIAMEPRDVPPGAEAPCTALVITDKFLSGPRRLDVEVLHRRGSLARWSGEWPCVTCYL